MKKKPKQYPMNGPSPRIQQLMERPITNRIELQSWANAHPEMRRETLDAIPK